MRKITFSTRSRQTKKGRRALVATTRRGREDQHDDDDDYYYDYEREKTGAFDDEATNIEESNLKY